MQRGRDDDDDDNEQEGHKRIFLDAQDGEIKVELRHGHVVPAADVIKQYGEDVLKFIMEKPDIRFTMLLKLEQVSKETRYWAQRKQLWARLCYRDYNDIYIIYKMDDNGEMKPEYKAKIDMISDNPNRNETYWKRLYEMMQRTKLLSMFDDDRVRPTSEIQLNAIIDQARDASADNRGKTGEVYLRKPSSSSDDKNTILYCIFTISFTAALRMSKQQLEEAKQRLHMVRVFINDRGQLDANVLPRDNTKLGVDIHYRSGKGIADFVYVYQNNPLHFVFHGHYNFILRFYDPYRYQMNLVSSLCIQCNVSNAQYKCGGCNKIEYCSSDCQVKHWENGHRDECPKE